MKKHKRGGQTFWDHEYSKGGHLALSLTQSEDLEKFTRWVEREYGRARLNVTTSVLDLGCGNGRNLFWLSKTFGAHGTGYDSSTAAIAQAKRNAQEARLPLLYVARSIAGTIDVPNASQDLVLDMMTSHFLNEGERTILRSEIYRVLKPGGLLFYKTFLLEGDSNARRMITENPSGEKNSYVHHAMHVSEHVSTEDEIHEVFSPNFTIHKVYKSHRHTGRHAKRRSIVVYMEKH